MKSERRHELQHNDLAEWAIKTYENVSPYRNAILGVTLLVVLAAIGWSIWRSHAASQAAEGWNAVEIPEAMYFPVFASPAYPGAMETAGKTYSGTPAGDWAQVLAADSLLYHGEVNTMIDKDEATRRLTQALERYKDFTVSSQPMARERALFGKARILESTGQLTEATAAYQELNKEFPQGTYKAIADQRLEQLGKPDTAEFYKAFTQYAPKPPKAEQPGTSPRSKLESIGPLPENPEEPVLPLPVKPEESSSGTAAAAPKTTTTALPAVPKPEAPKATATAPAEPVVPKPEAPKSTAATMAPSVAAPKATAAPAVPAASQTGPVKKDK